MNNHDDTDKYNKQAEIKLDLRQDVIVQIKSKIWI